MLPILDDRDCCLGEILGRSIAGKGTEYRVGTNIINDVIKVVNDVRYIYEL